MSAILIQLTRNVLLFWKCATVAKHLHETLLRSVMRSPMIFFDSNPVGRILNRFSFDIDIMESTIPTQMTEFSVFCFDLIALFGIMSFSVPLYIPVLIPIGIVFIFCRRFYIKTSRQLQRIFAVTNSRVFNHFCGVVHGATSIRAFRVMK